MFGKLYRLVLVCLILSLAATAIAAESSVVLSPNEEELSVPTGFERPILRIIKEETLGTLHRLSGYDEKGFQIMVRGIAVTVPDSRTEGVLSTLKKRLIPLGIMTFVIDRNDTIRSDTFGFLKGTDPYEILRVMHTNGEEYDISHEDVIDRLKAWEKEYPFDIIGAENDWVEIEFRRLPADIRELAGEIYDFCPNLVDDDKGSIQELIQDLQATKRLLLSWE